MGCRKICAALCGVQLQPGLGAAGFIAGISPLARLASQEAVQSCQPRLAVRDSEFLLATEAGAGKAGSGTLAFSASEPSGSASGRFLDWRAFFLALLSTPELTGMLCLSEALS